MFTGGNPMSKTVDAKISLLIKQQSLIVLFFEYQLNSRKTEHTALGFNLEKRGDIAQMNRICKFAGITFGNYFELDQKQLRLIVDNYDTSDVKGIGHYKKDTFFLTNGLGELLTKKEACKALDE